MCSHHELSVFLGGVERRAFKQAMFAVRREEAALDIVQDAMIKLAERYADKSASELPMLFQRILQTTILDHFRREKVRRRMETLDDDSVALESSEETLARYQMLMAIEAEVHKLPARQREAFLMRYWDDLDVAETALAMGCSEGSVKTHCSRAAAALARALSTQHAPARVQLQPAITTQPADPAPHASHGK